MSSPSEDGYSIFYLPAVSVTSTAHDTAVEEGSTQGPFGECPARR
jgi:hypothetical protein